MRDLIEHLNEVYVEWFMDNIESLVFDVQPDPMTFVGFDTTEWYHRGESRITYGGKPMERLLPSRDEYQCLVFLQRGLKPLPGHE
jgi:hypothetical protein